MLVLGIDAHKRTHTIVAIDERARKIAQRTINATTDDHLALVAWAQALGEDRLWAVEDCRHLSRRLERDLLGAGERVVRVPTKMMAGARKKSRDYGKSDPIDAIAVARAALQEPDLPAAQLDGPARELRLLVDHREDLVAERTRIIGRLRWHLHELNPTWDPPVRSFDRKKTVAQMTANLIGLDGTVARLARRLLERCTALTAEINQLDAEIGDLVTELAPVLLVEICGCGTLTAAKIVGETAECAGSVQGHLRPLQRHRPATGVVLEPSTASPKPGRQPPTQLRHPPHGAHTGPLAPRRPRLPPAPQRRWRHRQRSHPGPQTPTLRRHLPSPSRRR